MSSTVDPRLGDASTERFRVLLVDDSRAIHEDLRKILLGGAERGGAPSAARAMAAELFEDEPAVRATRGAPPRRLLGRSGDPRTSTTSTSG